MKKIEMIKNVGRIVVATGVSAIVSSTVKNVTSEETGTIKKLCISAGSLVLTGIACERAIKYFDDTVDSTVSGAKKIVDEAEEKTV